MLPIFWYKQLIFRYLDLGNLKDFLNLCSEVVKDFLSKMKLRQIFFHQKIKLVLSKHEIRNTKILQLKNHNLLELWFSQQKQTMRKR